MASDLICTVGFRNCFGFRRSVFGFGPRLCLARVRLVSFEQIVGLVLVVLAMLVGLAGSVLPGIPGPPLILIAAVAHRLWFGEAGASTWVLVTLAGLMVGSLLLDYVATLIGARRLGATWRGVVGAGIGAVVGIFAGLWGILVAPFIGATLGELLGGREFPGATRAGLGAVLGLLAGAVGKVACSAAMIGLFVANVVLRSHG